jgi:hypothetical protein
MKSYVVLFVASTMLLKPLWPLAEYVMNYDYIVDVLCENKDKPELQCDGKCYLAQMLAQESERNEKNPFGQQQNKIELVQPIYLQPLLEHDLMAQLVPNTKKSIAYIKTLFSSPHVLTLIRPPEVS